MEQVVAALDEIKGGKDWRTSGENKSTSLNTTHLENLTGLYCVVPRDYYSDVYDTLLEAGAPGVSTNFGVMADQTGTEDEACNEEWALVYTSLNPTVVKNVMDKVLKGSKVLELIDMLSIPFQFHVHLHTLAANRLSSVFSEVCFF